MERPSRGDRAEEITRLGKFIEEFERILIGHFEALRITEGQLTAARTEANDTEIARLEENKRATENKIEDIKKALEDTKKELEDLMKS